MTLALDPQGFPVWNGELLDLPPKERAVLVLLMRRQPQVVSKQAFADAAWGPVTMSDESLARCISRLRRLLPDMRIESVYGTGYRLVAGSPPRHSRLLTAAQASPHVVEAYLHARQLAQQRTPAALHKALGLLRRLVADEPLYAPARVALAEALAGAASWGLPGGAGPIGEGLTQLAAAERLDPGCPGLNAARAWLLDFAWRFDDAADVFMRALRAAPDDPDTLYLHGWHCLVTGDVDAAIVRLREALVLQPYSALLRVTLARALSHRGDFEAALAEAEATCHDHPESLIAATLRVGLLALLRPDAAVVDAAERLAESRDAPPYTLSVLSYALVRCDRGDQALALIDVCLACRSATPCSAQLHAAALLALGDTDRAAALVVAACEARCALLPMVLREPVNAALLAHPDVARVWTTVFGR